MSKTNFIDQSIIEVKSGNGGNGALAFHREKYVALGGPSGGNGGNGGSILFETTSNLNTLQYFSSKKKFFAENGGNGQNKNKNGKNGEDLIIKVPIGTQIFSENDEPLVDLSSPNQIWLGYEGGKGGRGNASFKSSKNNSPTLFENGEVIKPIKLKLNLKLLADVGILGFPNAGKSTFLKTVTNSKTEVGDYQFTTINPQLGVLKHKNEILVIADLPGLIEGAHKGKGRGIQFLKHLTRTKIILHFIDSSCESTIEKYLVIRKELENFSKNLLKLKEIIVLTKLDLISNEQRQQIEKDFKNLNKEILFISIFSKDGVIELLDKLITIYDWQKKLLKKNNVNDDKKSTINYKKYEYLDESDNLEITVEDNIFTIHSKYVEYWTNRIALTTEENIVRLKSKFVSKGIMQKLEKLGIKKGDSIKIKNTSVIFQYT